MEVVPLDKLSEQTSLNAVEVRVLRRWYSRVKQKETSYIVVDKFGDAIQVTTLPEYKARDNADLQVLRCYRFSRFICCKPATYLRSVSHPLGILFGPAVIVDPIEDSLIYPKYYFEFTEFQNLCPSTPTQDIITDYIGTLEEIVEGTTSMRDPFLRLALKNDRGDTIRCRIWKEIIQDPTRFDRPAIENAPRPAVIADTSVKITKPFEWIQLGATATTYVYLNPPVPKCSALKDRSHTTTSHSIPIGPVPIVSSTAEIKTVSELLEFDRQTAAGRSFVCEAAISNFTTTDSWFKSQCTIGDCTLAAFWRDESWICPGHWKIPACRYMYHISATISDSTGTANAIIYDEAGRTVIGCPCSEVITDEAILNPQALPTAVTQACGKRFRFQLKVQLYTKVGMTGFNINRAEYVGESSESAAAQSPSGSTPTLSIRSLPPQTPAPARPAQRYPATTGVKRSLPAETGTSSYESPPHA